MNSTNEDFKRSRKRRAFLFGLCSALIASPFILSAHAGTWFSKSKYAYFGGPLMSWDSKEVEGILSAGPNASVIGEDPWIQMQIDSLGWTCYMTEFSSVQIDYEGKDYYAAGTWEIQKATSVHTDNASDIAEHMAGLNITKVAIVTWEANISDIENVVTDQLGITDLTVVYFTDENFTFVAYGKQADETGKFPPGFVLAVYGLELGDIDMGYDNVHGQNITGGYFDSLIFVDWGGLQTDETLGGTGGPRIEVNLPSVTSYALGVVYVTGNWTDFIAEIEGVGTFSGKVSGFNVKNGSFEFSRAPPNPRADVNSDHRVNIVDISLIARAFGATKGSQLYDARADLNSDSVVNILDITMAAKDFGRFV